MSINFLKSEKGQGLVETLMAVAVAVIVVTSLISLAIFALRNSKQASYASQATQIAETQLQYLRSYRDNATTPGTSWAEFILPATTGTPNCRYASAITCSTIGTVPSGQVCKSSSLQFAPAQGLDNTSQVPFTYFYTLTCPNSDCSSTGGTVRASVYVTWSVGGRTECVYNNTDFTNWRSR